MAFSPDGKTLAAGGCELSGYNCSQDETRLWDVSDPAQAKPLGVPLTGHSTTFINSVAFSPDGKTLATTNIDDNIILWDLSDPAQAKPVGAPLTSHASAAWFRTSTTFSPDGKTLAAAECMATDNKNKCVQGQISLWDVGDPAAAEPLAPLTGLAYAAHSVAFSPDGKTLAAGSYGNPDAHYTCLEGELSLWDMRDAAHAKALGAPVALHTGVDNLRFSPDGNTLALGCEDGTIRLWDVSDATQATAVGAPLTGHSSWVWGLAFSPDGKTLASGAADGNLILWDMRDPGQTKPPLDASFIHYTDPVKSVAFSSDGKTLVFGSQNKTINLWDISNAAEAKPLGASLTGHTSGMWSVALSPDRKTLASGSQDNTIRLWDVSNPAQARLLGAPLTSSNQVQGVAFSPNGKTLASGNWDSTIQLWNVSDPARAKPLGAPLTGHTGAVTSVAFRPDGKTLASGSEDHTVRLWDVSDPAQAKPLGAPLTSPTDNVYSVAFSPDGKTLASGGCGQRDPGSDTCSQGQIILWDVSDPARAKPLGTPLTEPYRLCDERGLQPGWKNAGLGKLGYHRGAVGCQRPGQRQAPGCAPHRPHRLGVERGL